MCVTYAQKQYEKNEMTLGNVCTLNPVPRCYRFKFTPTLDPYLFLSDPTPTDIGDPITSDVNPYTDPQYYSIYWRRNCSKHVLKSTRVTLIMMLLLIIVGEQCSFKKV